MSDKLKVIKVTLSSGKIVYLRELKISDTETAAQMVALKANGDNNMLQVYMQKALLQLVLVAIADATGSRQALSAMQKEDLDSLLTMGEYTQLLKVISKISGGDDMGKEAVLSFEGN